MAEWWSIEVFDSQIQAALSWKDSYRSQLVESAITRGAIEWAWIEHRHGVVFEVCFADEARWDAFRTLPGVQAALDAVPDPVNGGLVYRGRGGGAGGGRGGVGCGGGGGGGGAGSQGKPGLSGGAGGLGRPGPAAERAIDLGVAELSHQAVNL